MEKEKKIFMITTMYFGYEYGNQRRSKDGIYRSYQKRTSKNQRKYFSLIRKRTWGWLSSLKEAKKCIRENWGDLYEGEYSYAVIEEVAEGILIMPGREWWYQWEGTWEKGKYKQGKKPKEYEGVCGFWT